MTVTTVAMICLGFAMFVSAQNSDDDNNNAGVGFVFLFIILPVLLCICLVVAIVCCCCCRSPRQTVFVNNTAAPPINMIVQQHQHMTTPLLAV